MLTRNAIRKQSQRAFPLLKECVLCGGTRKLQRHHPNINDAFSVVILCQKCHTKVEMARGTWGKGLKRAKVCVVCGRKFANYTHTRVKTCGKKCLSVIGRRNANKRWRTERTDLRHSATPSCRKSRNTSDGE